MTRQEKQRIIQAKVLYMRAKHPSITPEQDSFEHYDKTDTTANGLSNCIKDFLKYEGWIAERISVQGQARTEHYVDGLTGRKMNKVKGIKFTKSAMTKGSSDNHATIMGKPVKWEIKIGKDKASEYQKLYTERQRIAGAEAHFITCLTDFFGYYDRITATDTHEAKMERIRLNIELDAREKKYLEEQELKKHQKCLAIEQKRFIFGR